MTGDEAKEIRKRLGLTQAQLARVLGMSGAHAGRTVRRWELGEIDMQDTTARLLRYMERYGLPEEAL